MTVSEVTVTEDSYTIEIMDQADNIVEVTPSTPPTVEVSAEDTTVEVTGSPTTVVVTEQAANTVEVDEPSHVVVHTAGIGSGIGGFYNQAEILTLLNGALTWNSFDTSEYADLIMLSDFWTRVGNQLQVYTSGEAVTLEQTINTRTDGLIATTMIAVNANGAAVDVNATSISQTNARIDLQAVDIAQNGADISVNAASLSVQAGEIAAVVSDVSVLDGEMTAAQGSISVQAGLIAINASDISTVDGKTITNAAAIQVNTDSITSYVTTINDHTGEINSLQVELTATSATTAILQTSLDGTQADLQSVEEQMADHWSFTITEGTGGTPYVTSMGLTLHPDWVNGATYLGDDTEGAGFGDYVFFWDGGVGKIYRCILGHVADATKAPGVAPESYWVEDLTGKKSTFRVDAELFEIYDATKGAGSETSPLFQVSAGAVTLGYDVALQSSGWDAGDPGYSLDAAAKTAAFRDMTMSFSSGDTGDDANQAVRTATNTTQVFTSTPTTPYVVGDLWDRGPAIGMYRCTAAKTAAQSYSSGDWTLSADGTSSNTAAAITGQGDLATENAIDWDTPGTLLLNRPTDAAILNAQQAWEDLDGGTYYSITASGLLLRNSASKIVLGDDILGDGGTIFSNGKTEYDNSTNGFFLGWDTVLGEYTFGIGDGTDYMRWDGTNLILSDDLVQGSNVEAAALVVQVTDIDSVMAVTSATWTDTTAAVTVPATEAILGSIASVWVTIYGDSDTGSNTAMNFRIKRTYSTTTNYMTTYSHNFPSSGSLSDSPLQSFQITDTIPSVSNDTTYTVQMQKFDAGQPNGTFRVEITAINDRNL